MPTLGQELQRLRNERGINLHQIADATHIGVRFLQAIESDTYDILPGGIFNRAFVRKFAKYVGMDEEQALALYERQLEEMGGEEAPRSNYLRAGEFEEKQPGNSWLLSAIMFLLLCAGAYAAAQYFKGQQKPAEEKVAAASPTPEVTPTATPDAAASPTPEVSPSPGASPTPEASPSPGAAPALTPPPGGMIVQLTATSGECWISVKPDGLNTQQALLKAGETKEVTAYEKVLMNLGNYPALNIKVNGRTVNPEKLAPNRTSVIVKNVVITKDNFQGFFD
ncbi:MAG: helix-turn-helix domain-containing protein [Acidobacteria bacterium]|nr:helix-turn-helix domain-containing protein [Acidobacteriota bacterium]MBI3425142.1 helix-turn-helix domain-containing protein [Acidobacteriota bacterium]